MIDNHEWTRMFVMSPLDALGILDALEMAQIQPIQLFQKVQTI